MSTISLVKKKRDHFAQIIPELATSSSQLERRAIDAERVVEAMKKAEYMAEYVGEEFDGIVASVVKFGLFVELPNTIEGLVHITSLPEYYHFNERTLSLQGEKSGKVFKVGQPIRVKLVKADKETGDIDFEYLPSDFDVVEKIKMSDKASRRDRRKSSKSSKGTKKKEPKEVAKAKTKGKTKKGSKKPFYKEQAKKKSRKRS